MASAAVAQLTRSPRSVPASLAIGAVGVCAVVALVDPNEPGRYPTCPSQVLLGIDCPACGTLRGVHALTRGRLATALDHNVLLLALVPIGVWIWWRWARSAAGRPIRAVRVPPWAVVTAVAAAGAFTLARNLPVAGLHWLAAT